MNKFKVVAEYIWTVVMIVALLVFIIGVAFAIPIWFRPFYYMQIGPLNIVEESGFSYEQILAAYNDVMNYLNFGTPFGVGGLKCSESAASHFADCKILFDLDTWGVIISAVLLLGGFLLAKFAGVKPKKLGGFEFSFYRACRRDNSSRCGYFYRRRFRKGVHAFPLIVFPGQR